MGKAGIVIPQHETRRYGPGESIERTIPGDFLLTHGDSGNSALIRFGQTLRYRGGSKHFAHWTHAGLFVSEDGMIVEAVQSGVQERSVRAYHSAEYHVIHLTEASEEGRKNAVNFAMHCLHDRYGFLTDISITMMLLTASTLCFGVDGQMICSGLVARA